MATRYNGKMWDMEQTAARIAPELRRTDEETAELNTLKGNVERSIQTMRKEFEDASKPPTQ